MNKKLYTIVNGQLVEAQADPVKRKVLTPEEGRAILGLSRNTFMELLYSGQIRAVKAGKRWLVPTDAIDEFLDRAN